MSKFISERHRFIFAAGLLCGAAVLAFFARDLGAVRAATISDDDIKRSIVLVRISTVRFHQSRPWQQEPGDPYTVAGLVLPGGRILVLANDIREASLLEVTKFSSYRRSLAKVIIRDFEANLALLTVDDPRFFADLKPLPAALDPLPGDDVTAVKVDEVFRIYRESAHIMEVNLNADFGYTFLPVAVFRTAEPIHGGGLLLGEKGIVGFIGYSDQDKKAESIPPSTFDSFQKRAGNGYPGFVSQGFYLDNLVDPVRREFYRIPEKSGGAIVTRVLPGTSAFGVLKKEDILLQIDGVSLDDRGYYEDPRYGRQPAQMLLARKGDRARVPGEQIQVTVLRDRKKVVLNMPLRAYGGTAERIPWLTTGRPAYVLENGILFLELSVPFLREVYGDRWQASATYLTYLFTTDRFYQEPARDRVVIMAGTLPDDVNRGYEDLPVGRVLQVNDKPVVNLRQFHDLLEELARSGAEVARLEISGGYRIFMDLKNRRAINSRIQDRYRVPAPSFFGPAA